MNNPYQGPQVCLFCLERAAMISITKYGLPTLLCAACGTRSFVKLKSALRGLAWLAPVAEQIRERMGQDPSYAQGLDEVLHEYDVALSHRVVEAARPATVQTIEAPLAPTGTNGV